MVARGSWRAVGAKKLSAMPAGALRTVVASCILGQPGLAAARIAEAAVVRTRRGVRGSGVGLACNAPRLFDGLVLAVLDPARFVPRRKHADLALFVSQACGVARFFRCDAPDRGAAVAVVQSLRVGNAWPVRPRSAVALSVVAARVAHFALRAQGAYAMAGLAIAVVGAEIVYIFLRRNFAPEAARAKCKTKDAARVSGFI